MDTPKRRGLGRGLSALLPPPSPPGEAPSPLAGTSPVLHLSATSAPRGYFSCKISEIRPHSQQPRRLFAEAELAALAESIAAQGVLQPVIVRRIRPEVVPAGGSVAGDPAAPRYELIAGERRWRAAQQAGLMEIPAVVKEASDRDALEMALVENLQREDLNPLEVAEAYRALVEDFALTQEEVARRVGRQRSTVANHLRLLRLPAEVKQALESQAITMGHARAVLGLENARLEVEAFRRVLAGRLSVRETERLVQRLRDVRGRGAAGTGVAGGDGTAPEAADRTLARLAERLQRVLGTKVEIRGRGRRGHIIISYYSNEELDRLLERLEMPQDAAIRPPR